MRDYKPKLIDYCIWCKSWNIECTEYDYAVRAWNCPKCGKKVGYGKYNEPRIKKK